MTPKEKAKELVEEFYGITDVNFGTRQQKQCAIICVKEIINAVSMCYSEDNIIEYWKEVKQEIYNYGRV